MHEHLHLGERPAAPRNATPLRPIRSLLQGIALVGLASVAPSAGAVTCATSDATLLPAPAVETLRGYRASFRTPARLAVDDLGQVYVADPARGAVVVRAADGSIADIHEGISSPSSIAVDRDGNRLYVGDSALGRVTAFTAQWLPLFDLGRGSREFSFPADIAVDSSSGNVWVADSVAHQIKVYDANGARLFAFGERGTEGGQFQFPMGIRVDPWAAEVVVADQLNGRLQVFDLEGRFLYCIGRKGTGPGRFNMPQGVFSDEAGRIFVSDAYEGWIHVVDRQGATVSFIGDFGQARGGLSTPSDLVIDPSGRLFVSSSTTAKLEIFGLDSYSDPERFVPAEVALLPHMVDPSVDRVVTAVLEVPGYALGRIGPVTANGVLPIPTSVEIGDHDHDAVPDLGMDFELALMVATLPREGGTVTFTAAVGDLELLASTELEMSGSPDPGSDSDRDGVLDELDRCPGTSRRAPVSDEGCSVAQRCPCSGPLSEKPWKSHGEYVRCVRQATWEITLPPLSTTQSKELVREAALSDCGR